jgi:hypothetical protein
VPENSFDLGQVGFAQECAVGWGLEIDSADFDVKGIFLRSDYQIGADGAQFAVDLVADIGGNTDHGRGDGHAKCDGRAGENLAPLLPPEGFVDESDEHRYCCANMRLPPAISASSMMMESAVCSALNGTGLHPPAVPTDCGLIGAAQFLQITPLPFL